MLEKCGLHWTVLLRKACHNHILSNQQGCEKVNAMKFSCKVGVFLIQYSWCQLTTPTRCHHADHPFKKKVLVHQNISITAFSRALTHLGTAFRTRDIHCCWHNCCIIRSLWHRRWWHRCWWHCFRCWCHGCFEFHHKKSLHVTIPNLLFFSVTFLLCWYQYCHKWQMTRLRTTEETERLTGRTCV